MITPMTEMTPTVLRLKRDEHLYLEWPDGLRATIPIAALRAKCPCAGCREERRKAKGARLRVISGGTGPTTATAGEMVGNYAIRITFSDGHDAGLFSFDYLRELSAEFAR